MRTMRLPAAFGTALGVAIGLAPGATLASCAEFPPIAEHLDRAEVVFVGTVIGLVHDGRTAEVAVEEVWRGQEVPPRVTVYGAAVPEDPSMMTSVDRTYQSDARYLFAVTLEDGRLRDDSCTATQEWTDDLAAFRPTSVATPEPAEEGPLDGPPAPAVGIALAVLAIGAISLLAFRARP